MKVRKIAYLESTGKTSVFDDKELESVLLMKLNEITIFPPVYNTRHKTYRHFFDLEFQIDYKNQPKRYEIFSTDEKAELVVLMEKKEKNA